QTADELAIAGHAFGAELLGAGRRLLQHEPALRTGWDDYRVLHDLRLEKAEYLGAEILAAVTPTNTAAGNATVAQVHTLDAGRAHPDLEHRARHGQVGHLRRVELE